MRGRPLKYDWDLWNIDENFIWDIVGQGLVQERCHLTIVKVYQGQRVWWNMSSNLWL